MSFVVDAFWLATPPTVSATVIPPTLETAVVVGQIVQSKTIIAAVVTSAITMSPTVILKRRPVYPISVYSASNIDLSAATLAEDPDTSSRDWSPILNHANGVTVIVDFEPEPTPLDLGANKQLLRFRLKAE